eukprot:6460541-Amphidinium_carterae.1
MGTGKEAYAVLWDKQLGTDLAAALARVENMVQPVFGVVAGNNSLGLRVEKGKLDAAAKDVGVNRRVLWRISGLPLDLSTSSVLATLGDMGHEAHIVAHSRRVQQ